MTSKELVKKSVDLANSMMQQDYSQFIIEQTFGLLQGVVAVSKPQTEAVLEEFQEIVDKGLSEKECYYEMSQVFKRAAGIK